MGQDQSTWDYGVVFTGQPSKPPIPLESATSHTLKHDPFTSRWRCKCGYTLGDGREAFLAPCPMAKKAKPTPNKRRKATKKKKHL